MYSKQNKTSSDAIGPIYVYMYSKQNKTSSDAFGPISVICTLNKIKLAVMPLVQYLLYVL